MASRSARRREQVDLAAHLRAQRRPWSTIAATLRQRYELNGRVAMRIAHGWSQADAAEHWNARWPDEPKTFKNFSYWENWPGDTGYAPSLLVLDRLAEIYACDVSDLLAGWGEHRTTDGHQPVGSISAGCGALEAETLAWQVGALDLQELTSTVADWSTLLPEAERHWLLLKLSTAAASAAAGVDTSAQNVSMTPPAQQLTGLWLSRYTYRSSSRTGEFEGVHEVELRVEQGRLVGRSLPHPEGSELSLELTVDGLLATGSWSERTSPTGHYRAAVYRGTLQLVLDPTRRSLTGRWLGLGKRFVVNSGGWSLTWKDPLETVHL